MTRERWRTPASTFEHVLHPSTRRTYQGGLPELGDHSDSRGGDQPGQRLDCSRLVVTPAETTSTPAAGTSSSPRWTRPTRRCHCSKAGSARRPGTHRRPSAPDILRCTAPKPSSPWRSGAAMQWPARTLPSSGSPSMSPPATCSTRSSIPPTPTSSCSASRAPAAPNSSPKPGTPLHTLLPTRSPQPGRRTHTGSARPGRLPRRDRPSPADPRRGRFDQRTPRHPHPCFAPSL
jgi:hypothetical protein